MDIAEFRKALAEMPEEDRAAFLAALTEDYEGGDVRSKDQMARANLLRETPTPGMRDAGRFKVAANPMEHMGAVAQRGVGEYSAKETTEERLAASERKQDALQKILEQYMARGGPGGGGMPPGGPVGPIQGIRPNMPGMPPGGGAGSNQALMMSQMLRGR